MWLSSYLTLCALALSPSDLNPEEAAAVDSLFATWDKPGSPGCALAIVRGGETVYSRGYGSADLERGVANETDTVFRIASTSKQFTAACVALLEGDGVLSFDDPISKWIPEFTAPQGEIRIHHLVHHTSGIRDYLWLMLLAGYSDAGYYTQDMAFDAILRQEATNFAPGERYEYSNSGYFLLSIIVERATGKTLREFAYERIFEPLGMNNTHFHDDHTEVVPGRAQGYSTTEDGFALNMTRLEMCGDGGLFTTVEDLTRWMANFRDLTVGDEAWRERMLEFGVLNDGEILDYASGLVVEDWNGVQQIWHGGAFAGFRANMLHMPELGFGVVCLANVGEFDPGSKCFEVRDLLLGKEERIAEAEEADEPESEEFEPAKVERAQLERWEGKWLEQGVDTPRVIEVSARRRFIRLRGGGLGGRYQPLSSEQFRDGARELDFAQDDSGNQLVVKLRGTREATFRQLAPFEPTNADLGEYAGDYWSEELQVVYRLHVTEDGLEIRARGSDAGGLRPDYRDVFRGPFASRFHFERDGERITAFGMSVGSVAGIRFERVEH